MRVELFDNLRNGINLQASRVVIYDDFDNPIAAIVKMSNNQYVAVTAAHKKFNSILKSLGIHNTTVIDRMHANNVTDNIRQSSDQ